MDDPKLGLTGADPPRQTARAFDAVAAIFARSSGDKALADLHDLFCGRGIRRLTVATMDRDITNPVHYHYHADRAEHACEALDPQTLAFALASEQPCELPTVAGVRNIDPAARATRGRLAYAAVCPIRVAGSINGFCVLQSDDPLSVEDLAVMECASV